MVDDVLLDPRNTRFYHDAFQDLHMQIDGSEPIGPLSVQAVRPITDHEGMLRLLGREGVEVGLLLSLDQLDQDSRSTLRRELEIAYLAPRITHVYSVDTAAFYPVWDVQTEAGRRSFQVRSSGMDIRVLEDGRVFLRDADANRYWIPDINALDEVSRAAVEEFI